MSNSLQLNPKFNFFPTKLNLKFDLDFFSIVKWDQFLFPLFYFRVYYVLIFAKSPRVHGRARGALIYVCMVKEKSLGTARQPSGIAVCMSGPPMTNLFMPWNVSCINKNPLPALYKPMNFSYLTAKRNKFAIV